MKHKVLKILSVISLTTMGTLSLASCNSESNNTTPPVCQNVPTYDGPLWYQGEFNPNKDTGKKGDFYVNTTTHDLFIKNDEGWVKVGNLKQENIENKVAYANTIFTDEGISIIPDKGSYLIGEDVTFTIKVEKDFLFDSLLLNDVEHITSLIKQEDGTFKLVTKMVEGGFVVKAETSQIKRYSHLENAFADLGFKCQYVTTPDHKEYVLDGQNKVIITEWIDAYFYANLTIKNIIFEGGATFHAKDIKENGATLKFENCQFKYAKTMEHLQEVKNTDPYHSFDRLNNVRPGLSLDIETQQTANQDKVKVEVSNCTFTGENDATLDREVTFENAKKGYGHGLSFNMVGGDGHQFGDILIDGCEFTGHRVQAIQLSGVSNTVTIKNTKINSWGMNKVGKGAAIRGIAIKGKTGRINYENVFLGLDHSADNNKINQIYITNDPNYTTFKESGTYSGFVNIAEDGTLTSEHNLITK